MFRRFCVLLLGGATLSAVLIGICMDYTAGVEITDEQLAARCGRSYGEWCWPHELCDDLTSPCPGDTQRCEGKTEGANCGEDPEFLYPECCNEALGNETCAPDSPRCTVYCSLRWRCLCEYDNGILKCGGRAGTPVQYDFEHCNTAALGCHVIVHSCP